MKLLLGRYEVKDTLGRGGLGTVYLARDPAVNRDVAIKVIDLATVDDRSYIVKRLQREVYSAGNLSHPGIVSIYDVGQEGDSAYIVMEYLKGKSLEQLLSESPGLTAEQLRDVLRQTALALDYVHSRGIIHRDVKPSNILLRTDGVVKIMDFGIARITQSEATTQSDIKVGTLAYMAPEQFRNDRVDASSDEYGLAVTAYRMLTGSLPFAGDSAASLMFQILNESPQPVEIFNATLSGRVNLVLGKGLAKHPNDRYVDCTQFVDDLLAACDEKPGWTPKSMRGTSGTGSQPPMRREPPQEGDDEHWYCPSCGADLVGPEQLFCANCGSRLKEPAVGSSPTQPHSGAGGALPSSSVSNKTITGLSVLSDLSAPTDFVFSKTQFFDGDKARFDKIEESVLFYRNNLRSEYDGLSKQADVTYKLWVVCVALGFVILVTGIVLMFTAGLAKGAITACSTVVVYFIQRIFQQREDYYRQNAQEKSTHLQYGNQWLLVIQSIDAIQDPAERMKRQARLVDVLTEKLGHTSGASSKPGDGRRRKPRKSPQKTGKLS